MKKLTLLLASFVLFQAMDAQGLKGLIKNAGKKDSSGNSAIQNVLKSPGKTGLSNEDIISGLKEALNVGSNNAGQKLSAVDGFFKDAAIKILMPEEAKKVESKLRTLGMGKQVDNAILSMNRAAEDASTKVAPIFIAAIKQINFQDALGILKGGDFAATNYLKDKTVASLTEAFRPIIEASLQKVDATKYWNTMFTTYNKFSTDKVNPDLVAYVTEKALAGVFHQVAQEEQKIRKDPMARTSDILKKVFSN
ncbi:MAG TPA: DUF4197 domain-containing protein [Flavisolibacter sp.]|jgi:hypothetical protein|nr:DUF4197 domain-containing protein [Flavisolibacter sp.]